MNLLLDEPPYGCAHLPLANLSSYRMYQEWLASPTSTYRNFVIVSDGDYHTIQLHPMARRLALSLQGALLTPQQHHYWLDALREHKVPRRHTERLYEVLHSDIRLIHSVLDRISHIPSHTRVWALNLLNQWSGRRYNWSDYQREVQYMRGGLYAIAEKNFFIIGKHVQNIDLYHEHILPYFNSQSMLLSLEMDNHMKEGETVALLEKVASFHAEYALGSFHMKFKKMRHTKKMGVWNAAFNTMIIDPRNSEVVWHELGHMIYQAGKTEVNPDIVEYHVEDSFLSCYPENKRAEERFAFQCERYFQNVVY